MTPSPSFEKTSIVLNRFFVKQLNTQDCTVYEYSCAFKQNPEQGDEQREIASVCYKVGVTAVRLGNKIITKEPVESDKMRSGDWELKGVGTRILSCGNPIERKALESFERKQLEYGLRNWSNKTAVEKAPEGGLIWWIAGGEGKEKSGDGWEIHRGRRVDIVIDSEGKLYLEIDIHHRFYTPWTLHQWLEQYPDIPINYVRNKYKDQNNNYISWRYEDISDKTPDKVLIEDLGTTLADYHRKHGATEQEIQNSHVVYVKKANQRNAKLLPHLSQRLSPSLTMEMLANVAEQSGKQESDNIQEVFNCIKKSLDFRLKESGKTARRILNRIYKVPVASEALIVDGYILPSANLVALSGSVKKAGEVRYKGCVKVGETDFGCLNLLDDRHKYPDEVSKCIREVAQKSNAQINIDSYRTLNQLPEGSLDRQMFWQEWANKGINTVLVVMPRSPNKRKQQIRVEALQAGIATQFIVPQPKADAYKAMNVVLGLLCKAGWQPVRLEPLDHLEAADLIIGFDTGTNRELYYGTSAFAVLADGQSLGWELPDVQRGESFSGSGVWQTVSRLIIRFHQVCARYPKKLLLMRDGLVQEGEFEPTIKALQEKDIAVDIVGVRKSGAGRMGHEVIQGQEVIYRDAQKGSVVFTPKERSFTLVTTQPVSRNIGSVRPLRVVHEYGNTSLELLALQTYHLTQLHPASGFSSCRLPWVLHLADKSSKEFQRIGQISVLQNLNREKLIAV
ncbi:MAG: argonaute PAZ domain-containing protein [Microcoleaceae cyanobacterium]